MPDKLHVYQIGDDFKITLSDKKTIIYNVEQKLLSTRDDFKFIGADGDVVGWVKRGEILGSQFVIYDSNEEKIGSLQLNRVSTWENTLHIRYRGREYFSKDHSKGQSLDVKDKMGNIQFTIDKKILHRNDSYIVHVFSSVDHFFPGAICIILDVIYHA